MISYLRGKIIDKDEKTVTLDVGGVGYQLFLTTDNINAFREGMEDTAFHTHLVVKEDDLSLYGFPTKRELMIFEKLLTVSGIGPRSALNVLNAVDCDTIEHAVAAQDKEYLATASGVSAKNAEKIVLELKGKLTPMEDTSMPTALREESDALQALKALGYNERETREALKKIGKEVEGTEVRIKTALQILGKN